MDNLNQTQDRDEAVFRPIFHTTPKFYIIALSLFAVVIWGLSVWGYQTLRGLGITGLGRPVYWGVYITNFVFFVGISHAGTLISAILRVTKAGWRRPITRAAEAITVFALMVGPINIIIDLGRPDRMFNIFIFGRFPSPLLWDVMSIGTYFIGSIVYLYLPLIPDIAMVRDRLSFTDQRRWFYEVLSLGWTGTELQKKRLGRAIGIMAIFIIPLAISVHTVVSWVFAMTIQPGWHASIFGPYFVMGAIYSGIAALLIAMVILRKVYHLEDYLRPVHFNNLGVLLVVFTLLWLYFTGSEWITSIYGNEPSDMAVLRSKFWGQFMWAYWAMIFSAFVIPFFILAFRKTRTILGCLIASILIIIGMWIERYTIVVPSLSNPRLPWEGMFYVPSWAEISITAGLFCGLAFLYVVFSKVFPIVSLWEIREGEEEEHEKAKHYAQVAEAAGKS
ncbi:MAG: polysulfide reductase NrfD [Chloroflexi bacterium]|nr:polysulfide reductase NrfD [Chloroflexota bacterium]